MRDQCSSDSRTLLDQLQSEKSTVSRAVAQNRELKEQLNELQDKFVTLVLSIIVSDDLEMHSIIDRRKHGTRNKSAIGKLCSRSDT